MGSMTQVGPGRGVPVDVHGPLRADLLAWFARRGRRFRWRRTRDPWRILVSEVSLQQTGTVRAAMPWEVLTARFPTARTLAAAPVAEVLEAWKGLGYNRRAVNLHRAAQLIVARHRGRVPHDLDALLALPGVGPYTARAVLAFAFEDHVGVLDVNAKRVLSRLLGRPVTQADADDMVPSGEAWRWNSAVLDLGATVCRAAPDCASCPVAAHCAWHRDGGDDPWVRAKPQSRFEGSDRQGRGRLVDALRDGPVPPARLARVMGWPDDVGRAERVAAGVVADGLAEWAADGRLRLPR